MIAAPDEFLNLVLGQLFFAFVGDFPNLVSVDDLQDVALLSQLDAGLVGILLNFVEFCGCPGGLALTAGPPRRR